MKKRKEKGGVKKGKEMKWQKRRGRDMTKRGKQGHDKEGKAGT